MARVDRHGKRAGTTIVARSRAGPPAFASAAAITRRDLVPRLVPRTGICNLPVPVQTTSVNIPARVFAKAALTILITLLLIGFFRQIAAAVVMLALALVVAAVLDPLVGWLTRHRVKRGLASLVAILALLIVLGGLLAMVLPTLITEGISFAQNLPSLLPRLQRALARYPAVFNAIAREVNEVQRDPAAFFTGFLRIGVNILSAIVSGILILTLALYFLIDKQRVIDAVLRHSPPAYRERVNRTMMECGTVVRAYFAGQMIISALFSIFTIIVLLVLGVPYPLIIAAFAFFLDAIPNIGATLATLVTALVALIAESATDAIIIIVAFQVYQLVENNFLSPRILGGRLNIPPVLTLTAIIMGGQILGIIGIILAIPLAGMLPVLDRIWFTKEEPRPGAEAMPKAAD